MEMTTKDVFRSIFRHIVLVAVLPMLAVAITAYICWNVLPKTYTAETTMYVLTQTSVDTLDYSEINLSTQLVNDYREMAKSKRVISGACALVGITQKEFEDEYEVSVNSTTSTRLITLSVVSRSPAMAANLANAMAGELSDCILDVTNVENISIIDEATPPEVASGPKSLQYTAIAGVAALAVAIMLSLLIDVTNIRIKTREDVEKMLQLPVLAQIPVDNSK